MGGGRLVVQNGLIDDRTLGISQGQKRVELVLSRIAGDG